MRGTSTSVISPPSEIREPQLYKYFGGILIAHGLGTAALTVALLQLLR